VTAFSVLEQAPVRTGVPAGASIRDVIPFARQVDALGYHRFWIAEHHSMGAVASSAPEVLIGQVAAATRHLRVGSGGMLLPNHRPIHVAEQFLMLAALHPGRIDLGIGRSEGATDDGIVRAFARSEDLRHDGGYDRQLDELLAFAGLSLLPESDPLAGVRAGPRDVEFPPVFLLGSSLGSARNAARRGLGYGFAAYTNPEVAPEALRLYREQFVAARDGDRPHAILGLKVMVGEDDEHARNLALPWHLGMVRHRAGHPGPLMTVDEALAHRWTDTERRAEGKVDVRADVVGGPERVHALIQEHIERSLADEVIVTTNTFAAEDRLASYVRLATVMGLESGSISGGDGLLLSHPQHGRAATGHSLSRR
jgi:luciferase family oxidoreductase group 1